MGKSIIFLIFSFNFIFSHYIKNEWHKSLFIKKEFPKYLNWKKKTQTLS